MRSCRMRKQMRDVWKCPDHIWQDSSHDTQNCLLQLHAWVCVRQMSLVQFVAVFVCFCMQNDDMYLFVGVPCVMLKLR